MRLRDYRRQRGWTLAEMAARLDVSEMSVSRYERGRTPTPLIMSRIILESKGFVQPNDFHDLTQADTA